jgi:hypothetical protein
MFNLFKKKRKYEDLTLSVAAIADFLIDDTGSDLSTPLKDSLDISKLDYSLESLKHVDLYLDQVRKKRKNLTDEQFTKVVVRSGAYCGEVVRKLSKSNFYWINYDSAVLANPKLKSWLEKSVYTFYILFAEPSNFSFPMAKVGKYIDNGPQDSLYYLAVMILSQDSKNTPTHKP